VLVTYESRTPGIESADNTTVLLGHECEPQPDLLLRVLPEFGSQSETTVDDYIKGPPELIVEIAHSSQAIDLHSKHDDYARHGVIEYIVVCLQEETVRWFNLKSDTESQPDKDGIIRVQSFPGLWINSTALLARDQAKLMATLEQGLGSPEHSEFVQRLESQRRS
jgi:Uma2 family endonuclease